MKNHNVISTANLLMCNDAMETFTMAVLDIMSHYVWAEGSGIV